VGSDGHVDRYLHIFMLMLVDMMSASRTEAGLSERLIRLTGDDAACRLPDYERLAREIRTSKNFSRALVRAKALADENRLLAVGLLHRRKELCACEIQAATGLSHATVSHHMAVLADAGWVRSRREGKWMYYALVDDSEFALP